MLYDLKKIKHSVDAATWHKAVNLYEQGKVLKFTEDTFGYSGIVAGTSPYNVSISDRRGVSIMAIVHVTWVKTKLFANI